MGFDCQAEVVSQLSPISFGKEVPTSRRPLSCCSSKLRIDILVIVGGFESSSLARIAEVVLNRDARHCFFFS